MAVVNSVAALVTAYRDGADLVLALRERRWARGQAVYYPDELRLLDHLEMVMAHGSDAVQNQYEQNNHRLGEAFATGDQIARDAMNELVIHLQKRLMSRLKIAWQQDTHVDPHPLLEMAEDVQDCAIMCLMQLHQRLLAQEPTSIMHRGRPKLRKRKTTSSLHEHPYDSGAIPGATPGFIDTHPPVPSHSNLFGYHVEITRPEPVELDTNAPERDLFDSNNTRQDSMESEPRIQHTPSFTSGYIPIDFPEEEAQHWPEPPSMKNFQSQQRFADSPTLSPARLSSIGSMSSAGSREFEDLEHNPWSSHGAGSPISSYTGSCSPAKSPYAPSLVPEALAPRRTHSGGEMPMERKDQPLPPRQQYVRNGPSITDSMRQLQLESQARNDSYASSGIQPHSYLEDGSSEPDRNQNKSPGMMSTINFVAASNPFEPARSQYQNLPAPTPTRAPASSPSAAPEQLTSRGATYSWLPRTSPVPQSSMSSLRARQFQQRQATPPIGELEEPVYRPAPVPQRPQESLYRPTQPQASSPPRNSPPRLSPVQQQAVPLNTTATAYHWEPTSPPRAAPMPPMRAPERESFAPKGHESGGSRPLTTSSGSIMVLPPPVTPLPQSGSHQSFLANKRVSTVSSSGSSGSGGARPPPVPMPAMRTIPSSAPPGNVKGCLPSEKNKFAGFCKGAWRGQIGDQKKAYEDRSRPTGISTNKMLNYYKCKKCNFEGRAKRNATDKTMCPDDKVYGSNGILYRWEFLFKSHIESKGTNGSPLDASYGCMFCCATGRGTPIFAGVASLMNHLQEHRDVLPQGEIIYRMNAVVGRSPDPDEDFDVALPSLVI